MVVDTSPRIPWVKEKEMPKGGHQNRRKRRNLNFVKESVVTLPESPLFSPKFALGAASWSWSVSLGLLIERRKGGKGAGMW